MKFIQHNRSEEFNINYKRVVWMAEGKADAVHAELTQEVSGPKNKESIAQSVYRFEKLTPGEKMTGEQQDKMRDELLARVQKIIDKTNDPKFKSNPKFIELGIHLDALKDRINAAEVEFNTKLDILETNRKLAGKAQLDKAAGTAPAEGGPVSADQKDAIKKGVAKGVAADDESLPTEEEAAKMNKGREALMNTRNALIDRQDAIKSIVGELYKYDLAKAEPATLLPLIAKFENVITTSRALKGDCEAFVATVAKEKVSLGLDKDPAELAKFEVAETIDLMNNYLSSAPIQISVIHFNNGKYADAIKVLKDHQGTIDSLGDAAKKSKRDQILSLSSTELEKQNKKAEAEAKKAKEEEDRKAEAAKKTQAETKKATEEAERKAKEDAKKAEDAKKTEEARVAAEQKAKEAQAAKESSAKEQLQSAVNEYFDAIHNALSKKIDELVKLDPEKRPESLRTSEAIQAFRDAVEKRFTTMYSKNNLDTTSQADKDDSVDYRKNKGTSRLPEQKALTIFNAIKSQMQREFDAAKNPPVKKAADKTQAPDASPKAKQEAIDKDDKSLADELNKILDGEGGKPGLQARVDTFLKIDPKSSDDVIKARAQTRKELLDQIDVLVGRITQLTFDHELTEAPAELAKVEKKLNGFKKDIATADLNFNKEAPAAKAPAKPAAVPSAQKETGIEKVDEGAVKLRAKTLDNIDNGKLKGKVTREGFQQWMNSTVLYDALNLKPDAPKLDINKPADALLIVNRIKDAQKAFGMKLPANVQGIFGLKTYEKAINYRPAFKNILSTTADAAEPARAVEKDPVKNLETFKGKLSDVLKKYTIGKDQIASLAPSDLKDKNLDEAVKNLDEALAAIKPKRMKLLGILSPVLSTKNELYSAGPMGDTFSLNVFAPKDEMVKHINDQILNFVQTGSKENKGEEIAAAQANKEFKNARQAFADGDITINPEGGIIAKDGNDWVDKLLKDLNFATKPKVEAKAVVPDEDKKTREKQIADEKPQREAIIGKLKEVVSGYEKAATTFKSKKAEDFGIPQAAYDEISKLLDDSKNNFQDMSASLAKNDATLAEIAGKKMMVSIDISKIKAMDSQNFVKNTILEILVTPLLLSDKYRKVDVSDADYKAATKKQLEAITKVLFPEAVAVAPQPKNDAPTETAPEVTSGPSLMSAKEWKDNEKTYVNESYEKKNTFYQVQNALAVSKRTGKPAELMSSALFSPVILDKGNAGKYEAIKVTYKGTDATTKLDKVEFSYGDKTFADLKSFIDYIGVHADITSFSKSSNEALKAQAARLAPQKEAIKDISDTMEGKLNAHFAKEGKGRDVRGTVIRELKNAFDRSRDNRAPSEINSHSGLIGTNMFAVENARVMLEYNGENGKDTTLFIQNIDAKTKKPTDKVEVTGGLDAFMAKLTEIAKANGKVDAEKPAAAPAAAAPKTDEPLSTSTKENVEAPDQEYTSLKSVADVLFRIAQDGSKDKNIDSPNKKEWSDYLIIELQLAAKAKGKNDINYHGSLANIASAQAHLGELDKSLGNYEIAKKFFEKKTDADSKIKLEKIEKAISIITAFIKTKK